MNIKSPSYILKRCLIPVIIMIIFAAIVVALNNTTKVQIVSREGQTFEKGIVTEIIQDNLQPDGTRAGQQLVVVHMTSGAFEGEDIAMTSNSGYLFFSFFTVGMKVVVMQSVAGDTQISSVYSQIRRSISIGFVPYRRMAGRKRRPWAHIHLWMHNICLSAAGLQRLVAILDRSHHLRNYSRCFPLSNWRPHAQNAYINDWNRGPSSHRRKRRFHIQLCHRRYRLECVRH